MPYADPQNVEVVPDVIAVQVTPVLEYLAIPRFPTITNLDRSGEYTIECMVLVVPLVFAAHTNPLVLDLKPPPAPPAKTVVGPCAKQNILVVAPKVLCIHISPSTEVKASPAEVTRKKVLLDVRNTPALPIAVPGGL